MTKDNKPLKVVIRGIPPEILMTWITEDLTDRGFKIVTIGRMHRATDRKLFSLILLNLNKEENAKKIFEVTHVAKIGVRIEAPHQKQR